MILAYEYTNEWIIFAQEWIGWALLTLIICALALGDRGPRK